MYDFKIRNAVYFKYFPNFLILVFVNFMRPFFQILGVLDIFFTIY